MDRQILKERYLSINRCDSLISHMNVLNITFNNLKFKLFIGTTWCCVTWPRGAALSCRHVTKWRIVQWSFRHVCVCRIWLNWPRGIVLLDLYGCESAWDVSEFVLFGLATKQWPLFALLRAVDRTLQNGNRPALCYQVKEWVNTDWYVLQTDPLAESNYNTACCFV
jgi:hypothetical protein